MSRYNTQVLSSIRMLCRMQNIDEKVLYERAKLILSIYREVCWSTIDRANDVCDTLICTYGDSLDGALIYLENFAPDEARERFEERIRSLFETKENFGSKGAKEAQEVLGRVNSLFAGGELDEDAKDVFFQAIMSVYMDSKKTAREKYTPKKYRKHKDKE